ncbi:MAG: GAF domain-containing sensor histidine kinase [Acidimicrobiia bacterium]|nr:GAF domain-containing sensor histidine kinase [Acidimicrobiia bacterium]
MATSTRTETPAGPAADSHFERIFDLSPIPTWEQDYSQVLPILDRLRGSGTTDLLAFLDTRRDVLQELIDAVVVRNANRAAIDTYAWDPAEHGGRISLTSAGSLECFSHQLDTVWRGEGQLNYEYSRDRDHPGPSQCSLHWTALEEDGAPDYEHVIVAIASMRNRDIRNDQLQRKAKKLELLNDINRDIASQLDVDIVLRTIVDGVKRILNSKWVELLVLDEGLSEVVARHTIGVADGDTTSAAELHDGIGGWVLRNQQPTISADAPTDPRNTGTARARAGEAGIGALVIAPLTINGITRGTLATGMNDGDDVFAQPDLELLSLMAAHASFAVSNAMAVQQIEGEIAARDRLAAAVSHELRTPLTSVNGLSTVLSEQWDSMTDTERRDLVEVIARESADATEMVEDLLSSARADLGEMTVLSQPLDLAAQATMVLDSLGDRHGNEIKFSGGPVTVAGDPIRVRQVLRNLVTNAIRHGGNEIRVESETTDTHGLIHVIDNGPGVAPNIAASLFTDFPKGRQEMQASVGLGLSVSKSLAEAMGGTLQYERRGNLTHFWLRLPQV